MKPNRIRRRPGLESLECRLVMSGASTQVVSGTVADVGAVAAVTVHIPQSELTPGKATTLFRVTLTPTPGSMLQPEVISATGASGQVLISRKGSGLVDAPYSRSVAFFRDGQAGTVTLNVAGLAHTSGSFTAQVDLVGDLLGTGQVTTDDLTALEPAYLTHPGDGFYNPAADINENGFIGQGDARAIESNIPPLTPPNYPLALSLQLAPADVYRGPDRAFNSGARTNQKSTVTVEGHTTPNSIVFADSGLGDYTFTGPVFYANAQGNFTLTQKLSTTNLLTNSEYLVVDPYGHQLLRSFPILQIPITS